MFITISLHVGLKTWQCGVCGYNSNSRAKARRHLQSRHPHASITKSLVNLGLSLKLDLKEYRKETSSYTIIEAEVDEEMPTFMDKESVMISEPLVEELVEVGGEEIVISQELELVENNQLIVMI